MRASLVISSCTVLLLIGACLHDRATLLVECAAGLFDCGGVCVDVQNDPSHCGSCDYACSAGVLCGTGLCGTECQGEAMRCGNECVNTQTDLDHCGGCDQPCDAGLLCSNGTCASSCQPPTTECGGSCVDTSSDAAHCGDCDSPCAAGESCTGGECFAADCATLLAGDNTLQDGTYTIDPDGSGGEAPFEVVCNMSTDGGGWIELMLNDSEQLLMAEESASNGWEKCADDSAKHFDWITEGNVTPDFTGSAEHITPLSYANPSSTTVYSDAQMAAIRAVVGELSITTRMVANTADDDNGDWQNTMTSGHEVYIMGAAMTWILLTPGDDGECGGSSTTNPGTQAGFYLWHQSAAGSEVTGTTGLNDSDLTGIGPGDLIPHQVRLVVATGGGVAFGYEKQTFLVR